MEGFDAETAARVWQRVQSRRPMAAMTPEPTARELVLQSHALAGLYLGLHRMLGGRAGERLRELYRDQLRTKECLRGLCMLEGEAPPLPPMESGKGSARDRLRACVHREQRLGEALAGLAAEGEYAQVYGRLARQAGERCLRVLELLGASGG